MKKLTALAWKEWRESQAYLWIGLGVFLGLPVIGGLEQVLFSNRRFEIDSETPVILFGSVLAVIVAVGATSRDLRGRLEDFWRSRPVGVGQWMGIKFLVGLLIVLAACELPIAVGMLFNREHGGGDILFWFPFLWLAAYGLGFLAGCAFRQPATAGVAGLTAVLLLYCLPVVIPPLERFGISAALPDHSWSDYWTADEIDRALVFAAGMVVLSAAMATATAWVLRRDWRVPSGRKMVYGLIGVALIVVAESAAFQLGTNLPVQQQIDLPGNEWVRSLTMHGGTGVLLTGLDQFEYRLSPQNRRIRTVNVVGDNLVLGPPMPIGSEQWSNLDSPSPLESAGGVGFRRVAADSATAKDSTDEQLLVFDNLTGRTLTRLTFWTLPSTPQPPPAFCHVWNNRLYVTGNHRLMVYDLADPKSPRKILDQPFEPVNMQPLVPGNPTLLADLVDLPGVPAEARLKMRFGNLYRGDDGLLLLFGRSDGKDSMYVYKSSAKPTDRVASFRLIGQYHPSLLDEENGIFNNRSGEFRAMNLLYTSGFNFGGVANPQTTVFQLDPIKIVGHFSAPGARLQCLLGDGRALAAGDHRVYVVGKPRP